MTKRSFVVTLALALTVLTGCGTAPGMISGTNGGKVSAKDYVTVKNAQAVATKSLDKYSVLRDRWSSAYSDSEKDQLEDEMIVVLLQGLTDARYAVSSEAGAVGTDANDAYNVADFAIERYEGLRQAWAGTNDVNQQRQIANQMQTIMLEALKEVQRVQPNTYIVRSGDNLSMIAKKTLGNINRWKEIYELNRDIIGSNPNMIHVGAIIRLPAP